MRRLIPSALVLTLLAPVAAGAAATSFTLPVDLEVQPSCGGEPLHITGEQHFVVSTTSDAAGGQHVVAHTNYRKASAVGVLTGEI